MTTITKNERNAGGKPVEERIKREALARDIKVMEAIGCSKAVIIKHIQEKMDYTYQQAQRLGLKVRKGEI